MSGFLARSNQVVFKVGNLLPVTVTDPVKMLKSYSKTGYKGKTESRSRGKSASRSKSRSKGHAKNGSRHRYRGKYGSRSASR